MKILFLLTACVTCVLSQDRTLAPLTLEDSPTRVPGEYVIVLKEDMDIDVTSHMSRVRALFAHLNNSNVLLHEYNIGSFRGYGARMGDRLRDQIRRMSQVKFVEASQVYEASHFDWNEQYNHCGCQQTGHCCKHQCRAPWTGHCCNHQHGAPWTGHCCNHQHGAPWTGRCCNHQHGAPWTGHCCNHQHGAPWGLVRTTRVDRPSDDTYIYEVDGGQGVDVYVLDTGIHITHPLFGGRAVWGHDCVQSSPPATPPSNHGTHVAGTIIANTYGIARGATAIDVRVLVPGTTNTVICGINYVRSQHHPGKRSIINMSLGGGVSPALNAAVDSATAEHITSVVAAGNSFVPRDACTVSPASASSAFTAAASDENDQFASFSNHGGCVNVIAPGVDVISLGANGGTNTLNGTSMAAPHVAGVMAKYLSEMSQATTPATIKSLVERTASINKISGNLNGTPNKLVFKCC